MSGRRAEGGRWMASGDAPYESSLGQDPNFGLVRSRPRWIIVHMLEETARHVGHLDLMRENIDGQVGDFSHSAQRSRSPSGDSAPVRRRVFVPHPGNIGARTSDGQTLTRYRMCVVSGVSITRTISNSTLAVNTQRGDARRRTAPGLGESVTRRGHLPQALSVPYKRHGLGRCVHLRPPSPGPSRWRSRQSHRSPTDTWRPKAREAGDWAQRLGRHRGGHRPSGPPVRRYCGRRGLHLYF